MGLSHKTPSWKFFTLVEIVSDLMVYRLRRKEKDQFVQTPTDQVHTLFNELSLEIIQSYRLTEEEYPHLNGLTVHEFSEKIIVVIWETLTGRAYKHSSKKEEDPSEGYDSLNYYYGLTYHALAYP